MRAARAAAILLACAFALPAQDPVADFDRSYARAQGVRSDGAAAAEVATAFRVALDHFLKIPPDDAAHAARLPAGAFSAHLAGDLPLASELYADALARQPADPVLVEWSLLAVLDHRGPRAALERAAALVDAAPGGVEGFVLAARRRHDGALFEEAARRLRHGDVEVGLLPFRIAARATGDPIDQANLALSLRFLGELDEAIARYRQALEGAPRDPVLWNDFGLCLKAAGRIDEAIGAFRRSIQHEAAVGAGPGWTNLALLAHGGLERALPDLGEGLRNVLRRRPDQVLCRRMMVDLAVEQAPDAGAAHDTAPRRR